MNLKQVTSLAHREHVTVCTNIVFAMFAFSDCIASNFLSSHVPVFVQKIWKLDLSSEFFNAKPRKHLSSNLEPQLPIPKCFSVYDHVHSLPDAAHKCFSTGTYIFCILYFMSVKSILNCYACLARRNFHLSHIWWKEKHFPMAPWLSNVRVVIKLYLSIWLRNWDQEIC